MDLEILYARLLSTDGLVLSLKRPSRRRNVIYESFVDLFITREINKSLSNRSGLIASDISFECHEYAKRFALSLTSNGKSKLSNRKSKLLNSYGMVSIEIGIHESEMNTNRN